MARLFPLAFISATNNDKFRLASKPGRFIPERSNLLLADVINTDQTDNLACNGSEYRFSKAVPRA